MDVKAFRGPTRTDALDNLHSALGQDAHVIAIREHDGHFTATGARAARIADLEALLTSSNDNSPKDALLGLFRAHGVPEWLGEAIVGGLQKGAPEDLAKALNELFKDRVQFSPIETAPQSLLFFGPTGAGKTASLVRLAARLRAQDQAVAVATTDIARTSATHQLQALLAPLEIEPMVAETRDELALIRQKHERATLLIDSTGLNPLLAEELATIADMIDASDIEPVLVVPAGLDASDAFDISTNSRALGARKSIITKLDAARRFGSVLAMAEAGLALAETSISPLLAKPLLPWTAEGLTRLLLRPMPKPAFKKG
ncbi:MAG: hypothetical protein AAFY56_19485 [Pseudomonadota bacterium]